MTKTSSPTQPYLIIDLWSLKDIELILKACNMEWQKCNKIGLNGKGFFEARATAEKKDEEVVKCILYLTETGKIQWQKGRFWVAETKGLGFLLGWHSGCGDTWAQLRIINLKGIKKTGRARIEDIDERDVDYMVDMGFRLFFLGVYETQKLWKVVVKLFNNK